MSRGFSTLCWSLYLCAILFTGEQNAWYNPCKQMIYFEKREKVKKGDIVEGIVEEVLFPNKGHIDIDGEAIVVKNAIPGQKVRLMISKKRSGRYEGRILEVIEKSPLETREKACGIFPECGGCTYQTMDYDAQLAMKYTQVQKLLSPVLTEYGGLSVDAIKSVFGGITGSPDITAYRNKMEYTFGDAYKDGPLTLGLHKKGSGYDILTAADCAIVHDDINKIVNCVLDYCTGERLSYYHKNTHVGFLRHLLVRRAVSTGEIIAAIVTTTQEKHDFGVLVKGLLELPLNGAIAGILHMENDSVADVVRSDNTEILFGQDYFYEHLLDLKFKITPFSFFQTNTKGAEILYTAAREMIGDIDNATVFDLYSGTGTIAQVLSPSAEKVIGIEIVEEAVHAARENARLNGINNCEFYAGDVLKMLDEINERPDFIVLDPPREGIHPKALKKIIDYGADRIVYVSCKPTSLANDLKTLLYSGYKVEKIKCVDMFPNTVHVETCVLLAKTSISEV